MKTTRAIGYVFDSNPADIKVLFENGMYDIFKTLDVSFYLKQIGKSGIQYHFRGYVELEKDYKEGQFDGIFRSANTLGEDTASGDEDIRETFRKIQDGKDKQDSFITSFANTLLCADGANFALLKPAALELMRKYSL